MCGWKATTQQQYITGNTVCKNSDPPSELSDSNRKGTPYSECSDNLDVLCELHDNLIRLLELHDNKKVICELSEKIGYSREGSENSSVSVQERDNSINIPK